MALTDNINKTTVEETDSQRNEDGKVFIQGQGGEFKSEEAIKATTPVTSVEPITPTEPITPEPVETAPETIPGAIPGVVPETPIEEPKVEEPKAPVIKSEPTKVEDVQVTKSNKLSNDITETEIKEKDEAKITADFSTALNTGASVEELASISNNNPELRDTFNSLVRDKFKNTANAKFFNKYSGFTNTQLAAEVANGNIVPGSERYNLLPEAQRASFNQYQKEVQAVNINNPESDKQKFEVDNTKTISLDDMVAEVSKMYSSDIRKKSDELLNTDELNNMAKDLGDKQIRIDKLNREIAKVQKDVEKRYPTKSAGRIAIIVADEVEALTDQKNGVIDEYNSQLGTYNTIKENAQNEIALMKYEDAQSKEIYTTALSLYETRRKEARADMSAEAQLEADRENTLFEAQNKMIAEDLQWTRDIALLEYKAELADKGVTGEWIKRDDGLYFAKSDGTADKVVGNIGVEGITGNINLVGGSAYSEVYDINNNGVGFTSQNTSLGSKERELLNAPNGTRIPTRLNKEQLSVNNPGGKECGEYVNDIVASTVGQKIGSKWQDKLNYANESTGELGSVAVWKTNPNVEDAYGHTGIIVGEGIDENGNDAWHIKSSNIKGVGVVSLVSVPKSVISGYKATGIIKTDKKVAMNVAQVEFLDSIADTADLVSPNNKTALKELNITLQDALTYKAENITELKKGDYKTALLQIDRMLEAGGGDGFSDALGYWEGAARIFGGSGRDISESGEITFPAGSDAADFQSQFKALVDSLTLPNLDKMSGVLTDKDIELLRNAATGGLNLNMSEKEFKKTVTELQGALNRAINGVKIPDEQVVYTDQDGLQYSKDTLSTEIAKMVEDGTWTVAESQEWIKENNLLNKLK